MTRVLTPVEIARYAYDAGFRGVNLIYAVAIAIKESGGNIAAYNPETAAGTRAGSGSRGLWQIYGAAHPEFNNDSMYDPAANARAAYKVFREAGGRFTPWSTWNNGSAQAIAGSLKIPRFTSPSVRSVQSAQAVASLGGSLNRSIPSPAQAIEIAASPFLAFAQGASANSGESPLRKLTGHNIEDFIGAALGMILIVIALSALFVASGAAEKTIEVTGTAAKAALL